MEELEPIEDVGRRSPEPGAQFKTFYTRIVRVAMHYAVQHVPFRTAQEVTQRTAYKCWRARLSGADAAELMIRDGASALCASLREGIVRSWRRERPKAEVPAEPLPGVPPAELKRRMEEARRKAIVTGLALAQNGSRGDARSGMGHVTPDELPLEAQVAATIDYFMHAMSAEEEEAFEHLVASDAEYFARVSPVAMALVWPGAVRGPGGGDEWKPKRASRVGQAWQDYRMPARGVELMWRWFCEVVGGRSFR
jgi:hypothetical protein